MKTQDQIALQLSQFASQIPLPEPRRLLVPVSPARASARPIAARGIALRLSKALYGASVFHGRQRQWRYNPQFFASAWHTLIQAGEIPASCPPSCPPAGDSAQ